MIWLILTVALVGLWAMRRRRKNTLAGLNSAAPTFTLAPPSRWSTTSKDHRL